MDIRTQMTTRGIWPVGIVEKLFHSNDEKLDRAKSELGRTENKQDQ